MQKKRLITLTFISFIISSFLINPSFAEGEEAVASIGKVWEGLTKSDWSVRAPAGEKITKSSLKEKMSGLSEKEQAVAAALLAKLGVKL